MKKTTGEEKTPLSEQTKNHNNEISNDKNNLKQKKVNYYSAFFFLLSSMVGIGYLTLSANFKAVGLILGLILIFITGIGSLFGSFMLGKVYYLFKTENYPDLVYKVLGKTHYIIILCDLLFYIIFSTTMYIYFSTELIFVVFNKYKWDWGMSKVWVKLIIACCGFILALFSLQKVRWASYLGNFFSFFGAAVLIIQMNSFYNEKERNITYFNFNWSIFPAIGACFFAFTNHFSVVTVIKILNDQSNYAHLSAINRSQYFALILYTTVAFAGYISFGEDTPTFVLLRDPLEGSNDIAMTIAQLGLVLSLLVALCVRITSAKDTFLALLTNKKDNNEEETEENNYERLNENNDEINDEKSTRNRMIEIGVSFTVALIAYISSLFLEKKVISVISLLTSILCPYFIIIAPSLMTLKMADRLKLSTAWIRFVWTFMIIFCIILSFSVAVNLYDFINDADVIG